MTFDYKDALARLNVADPDHETSVGERFSAEVGGVQTMTREQASDMFPGVSFSESPQIVYAPFRMCHTMPAVNARRRSFMPAVLARSVASTNDSLINLDHELIDNGINTPGGADTIIGHIKAAVFGGAGEIANNDSVPEEPIPMIALGALYNRHSKVPGIVDQYLKDGRWKTSMECGHKWTDACLYYKGEFIPFTEAEGAMLEGITPNGIRPYKGGEITACLGGLDGRVDFWGAALTCSPADENSDIITMFAGGGKEAASRKTFLPLNVRSFPNSEKTLEVANKSVDTFFNDIATIEVIGQTQPAEDGHSHDILSDGTIVPANNHTHFMESYSLSTGTRPRYTGRTSFHYEFVRDSVGDVTHELTHMHLLDIPLRGSKSTAETSNYVGDAEMQKFATLLDRMEGVLGKLSSGNNGNQSSELASEIASLRSEISRAGIDEQIDKAVEEKIKSKIDSGELLTKEAADERVTEAVGEVEEKHKAEVEQMEKVSKREEAVSALGIDIDYTLDEDDEESTIRNQIRMIPNDEAGDKLFKRVLKNYEQMAENHREKQEKNRETVPAAASKPKKKRSLMVHAGSAPGDGNGSEVASSGDKKVGRHMFTK